MSFEHLNFFACYKVHALHCAHCTPWLFDFHFKDKISVRGNEAQEKFQLYLDMMIAGG